MQIIPLSDVLKIMATTTQPFNLVVVTADRKRNKGGELLLLEGCLEAGVMVRNRTAPALAAPEQPAPHKQPGHFRNSTRNVVLQASNQCRKIHIRLIISFNGNPVRW